MPGSAEEGRHLGAHVELAFATKQVRAVCERERVANRALGEAVAKKLRARLADLRAAANAAELVTGSPRKGGDARQLEFRLGKRFALVIGANHRAAPTRYDGGVDWARVTRVKILSIEDNDA